MQPIIAIVVPNTLAAIGLSDIIRRMMPGAEVRLFAHYADLVEVADADQYFHYFVSGAELLVGASYFLQRQHKTIALVHGDEVCHLPQGFHTLNVFQTEQELVRSIITLAQRSHTAHGAPPEVVRKAQTQPTEERHPVSLVPHLTPREREVLKGIVEGLINKEIAARMGVSLATVITHRNNLTDKLGTRSVAALTIFAIMHGLVSSEDLMKNKEWIKDKE